MKKILMIGYCNKFFRKEYAKNIEDTGCCFDILSFEKAEKDSEIYYNKIFSCDNPFKGMWHVIGTYIKFFLIILTLPQYDAIHIHAVKKIESIFAKMLRKKCRKLVCTIYGSDFYRISNQERKKLCNLFDHTDYITIETEKTIEDFNVFFNYRYDKKIINIRFGISSIKKIIELQKNKIDIDSIKKIFGIPADGFVITVGYNATKEQNHIEILEQIKNIEMKLPSNYYIVIPLGYGDKIYGRNVAKKLEQLRLRGCCLFDFYDNENIAKLRIISSIMIQLQDTDSLSSSMIEYLYAGNIIITGSWLPYREIQDYIITIEKIDNLSQCLADVLKKYEIKKNSLDKTDYRNFVENNFIWENVKYEWKNLYA